MENQETKKFADKTTKTLTENAKEIVKKKRRDNSQETGDSLKKLTKTEAKEMEEMNKLYEQIDHKKNPYVAGATAMLTSLKEKDKPILPKGFPDKPVVSKKPATPARPPSEPEVKFPTPPKRDEGPILPKGFPDKPVVSENPTMPTEPPTPEVPKLPTLPKRDEGPIGPETLK
jgi:hypothetical protein